MVFLLAFSLAICLYYVPKNNIPVLSAVIIASVLANAFSVNGYVKLVDTVNQLDRTNPDYLPMAMLYDYREGRGYVVDTERIVLKPESGKAEIRNMVNNAANMDFDIEAEAKTEVSLPRTYYWGYEATIEYASGEVETVDAKCDEYGYVMLEIDGTAHVRLRYTGKAVLPLMRIISVVSVTGFAGAYVVMYLCDRKKSQK